MKTVYKPKFDGVKFYRIEKQLHYKFLKWTWIKKEWMWDGGHIFENENITEVNNHLAYLIDHAIKINPNRTWSDLKD